MHRTLEAIFHRPIRLLTLLVLLPLVGLAIAYVLPRSYQSTATLWALRRYGIAITTDSANTNLTATPADTQTTALSELLQTRTFTLAVTHGIDLASTLELDSNTLTNPQLLDNALFNEISHHVQARSLGYNLFAVSYTNHNPKVAQQIVEAVIHDYGLQSQGFDASVAQHLLQSYQQQLADAKVEIATDAAEEATYLQAHPKLETKGASPLSDPHYALLEAQRQQAQTKLQGIQSSIDNINQQIGAGADSLFQVLDPPQLPNQPVSRLGLLLIAGAIGLGTALLACILYIVISVRRDSSAHTALDLRKVTTLPIVMQIPRLASTNIPLLAIESINVSGSGKANSRSDRD